MLIHGRQLFCDLRPFGKRIQEVSGQIILCRGPFLYGGIIEIFEPPVIVSDRYAMVSVRHRPFCCRRIGELPEACMEGKK